MSKFTHKLGGLAVIFGLILVPAVSLAQVPASPENSLVLRLVAQEVVKLEDLGIEDPGLLQSNPFYFMKNWRRSTQRVFKINPVQKADLELDFLNEKAAELKRLEEILPDNEAALSKALDAYRENLKRLPNILKSIKESNIGADRLLDKLLDRSLKHVNLFDSLKAKSDIRTKEKLEFLQGKFSEIIADTLTYLDSPEKFEKRFKTVLDLQAGGVFKEFRAAEALDRIEGKTPYNSGARESLLSLKEKLFLKSELNIKSEDLLSVLPAVFQQLPGDFWRRIKIIDEAREYLSDSDFKNDLGIVRQLILELASRAREIGKSEAERAINDAENLIRVLSEKISAAQLKASAVSVLLSRAEFNLKQAKESFDSAQYSNAFGHASAAAAAAKNGLHQVSEYLNLGKLIKDFSGVYDQMLDSAENSGLTAENSPEFFKLLALTEKALANLSDLAIKNTKIEVVAPALRDVKILLLEAEQSLKDLLRGLAEETEARRASQPLIQRVLQ